MALAGPVDVVKVMCEVSVMREEVKELVLVSLEILRCSKAWARYSIRRSELISNDLISSSTGHLRKNNVSVQG